MKLLPIMLITFLISAPPFSIVRNTDPYPAKIFIHSMSQNNYMSILNNDLSFYWIINNDNKGMDFKVNNSKITFYHPPNNILNDSFYLLKTLHIKSNSFFFNLVELGNHKLFLYK